MAGRGGGAARQADNVEEIARNGDGDGALKRRAGHAGSGGLRPARLAWSGESENRILECAGVEAGSRARERRHGSARAAATAAHQYEGRREEESEALLLPLLDVGPPRRVGALFRRDSLARLLQADLGRLEQPDERPRQHRWRRRRVAHLQGGRWRVRPGATCGGNRNKASGLRRLRAGRTLEAAPQSFLDHQVDRGS